MLGNGVRNEWLAMLSLVLMLLLAGPAMAAAEEAKSALAEVTLYRDQAQITRAVAVPKGAGPIELIVSGLPSQVQPDSLFAEGGEAIDVRAVRFRERVVGQEPRDDIRALDEQIAEKQIALEENTAMKGLIDKRFKYLDQLEGFTAPTATTELSKGVLDANALRETTKFVFEQRESATKELLALNGIERELKKDMQTLQQRRAQLAGRSQTTVREAVLFLDRRDANADAVRLTYLVGNCGWSPSYNVRGDLGQDKVRIEYNAIIRQMTGEDWDSVKLTLSTASPIISASGPSIAAFPVSLRQLNQGGRQVNGFLPNAPDAPQQKAQVANDYNKLQEEQVYNFGRLNTQTRLSDNADFAWSGNVIANRLQLIELCEPVDKVMPMVVVSSPEQGLSISYTIDGAVSLQSRADQQMTRIMQSELDGEFYHVANPVLSQYVYREAAAVNTSGRDLLAGPVNAYLDGRFVGRTEMVNVTRGQTFLMGFGADPQLTATRKLVKREQQQQGGNTRLTFAYRLAIENYGAKPAEVRLYDRLPYFNGNDDVQLTEDSGFGDLSKDPVYLREDRPRGILRWDITVPANAAGEQAAVTEYRYTIEFDRNFGLSSEVDEKLKMDFKERDFNRRAF